MVAEEAPPSDPPSGSVPDGPALPAGDTADERADFLSMCETFESFTEPMDDPSVEAEEFRDGLDLSEVTTEWGREYRAHLLELGASGLRRNASSVTATAAALGIDENSEDQSPEYYCFESLRGLRESAR